jgi:hypothetical protein
VRQIAKAVRVQASIKHDAGGSELWIHSPGSIQKGNPVSSCKKKKKITALNKKPFKNCKKKSSGQTRTAIGIMSGRASAIPFTNAVGATISAIGPIDSLLPLGDAGIRTRAKVRNLQDFKKNDKPCHSQF